MVMMMKMTGCLKHSINQRLATKANPQELD